MAAHVEPYEFLEPILDRRDEQALEEFRADQLKAREIALKAPLHSGFRCTLDLELPAQNSKPNGRKLPQLPLPGASTTLEFQDELQRGINWFSQVWTASPIDHPETCLVLKIIQPSIYKGPPDDYRDEYFDPYDVAHNEAWVYKHLGEHQGLLIPYFFGLFSITTACGEAAWVLVLEFIRGFTAEAVAKSGAGAISNIRSFCTLGIHAVQRFIRGRWSLADVRLPNVILTRGPEAWSIVLIDLFLSEPLRTPQQLAFEAEARPRDFYFAFAKQVYPFDNGILEWAKENLPRFVWDSPGEYEFDEDEMVNLENIPFDIDAHVNQIQAVQTVLSGNLCPRE